MDNQEKLIIIIPEQHSISIGWRKAAGPRFDLSAFSSKFIVEESLAQGYLENLLDPIKRTLINGRKSHTNR